MEVHGAQRADYVVPTYQAPPGVAWYHFLHGNVPGHQIDFMYRPVVPQGPLTRQHFSHLARLVRYIEPRPRSAYAFAIGNLSRDDTQYEPGRGGVALLFGLRIRGAKDHAGRQDPPFCHAVAAVDRHLDGTRLLEAALGIYHRLLQDEESMAEGSGWYHTYVRHAQNMDAALPLLRAYVADFEDIPAPAASGLGLRWTAEAAATPRRIVIVHREGEPFAAIAACAARIAGVLVESNIRWTAISNGREADVPGGVSVRFVPQEEAVAEEARARVLRLEEVPEAAEGIAGELFGAQEVRISQLPAPRMGWRDLYGKQASTAGEEMPVALEDAEAEARSWAASAAEVKRSEGEKALEELAAERGARRSRAQVRGLVGIGVALTIGGAVAAVVMGTKEAVVTEGAQAADQVQSAAPVTTEPPGVASPSAAPSGGAASPAQERAQAGLNSGASTSGKAKGAQKPAGAEKKGGSKQPARRVFGAPLDLKR